MAEEFKSKITEIKDGNFTDTNGNLYFWIKTELTPTEQGQIALKPGSQLKVGDEIHYTKEVRTNSKGEQYFRYKKVQEQKPGYGGGGGGKGYSKDLYSEAVTMAYSYAKDLAIADKFDQTKIEARAVELLNSIWHNLDEAKKRNAGS